MLRKLRKAKKLDEKRRGGKKRIKPISRPDTDIMISNNSRMIFRIVMFFFFSFAVVLSGYAPKKGPTLPPGFCQHGDITDTTGECMCHWQHKDGCTGSGCEYQMGLSFYHHSCKDCVCVQEP